jgi:hypothetical protein
MTRLALSHLRHRAGRTVALLLGVLAATTGFTVLTGATDTSRLMVRETVEENARGAYDILVRPAGGRSEFERDRVRPNFLSDMYGGLTAEEWAAVRATPGVEIAAPVAMLGYVHWDTSTWLDITRAVDPRRTRQVLSLRPTWRADRGLTSAADERPGFVYVTRRPVAWPVLLPGWSPGKSEPFTGEYSDGVRRDTSLALRQCGFTEVPYEVQEDGRALPICASGAAIGRNDFWRRRVYRHVAQLRPDGRFVLDGHRSVHELLQGPSRRQLPTGPSQRLEVPVVLPMALLLAAIDPAQEAALVGLDKAVVSGGYLTGAPPPTVEGRQYVGNGTRTGRLEFPVLVSGQPYVDEQLVLDVHRLDGAPAGRSPAALSKDVDGAPGIEALSLTVDAAEAYAADPPVREPHVLDVRTLAAGRTGYTARPDGTLDVTPQPPVSRLPGWGESRYDPWTPRLAAEPAQRQMYDSYVLVEGSAIDLDMVAVGLRRAGVYDPERLTAADGLGAVPLETYRPAVAEGADEATRTRLGGQPLEPSDNPGGYLTAPPSMLLDLNALLEYSADPAPISAVRVRVAGIGRFDATSRERIRVVAEDIVRRTGLDVDIVYGSSPGPQSVRLPAGSFGRPELVIAEQWSLKGVATRLVSAVDRKSAILFVLILVVSAMFLANGVSAAVRDRRRELAVLACLGWPARRLALAILTEVAAVGLLAGLISTACAPPLGALTGVSVPPQRALLALPIALALTLVAGIVPALRAARSHPADAIHPASRTVRRIRRRRTVAGLAVGQAGRVAGRTALAVLALAIGVCAVTLLAVTTFVFHGAAVGTLLGDAVSFRARGVDLAGAACIVLLGAVAIADVLFLNIRERSGELAALRAMGWPGRAMVTLVAVEATVIGAIGSSLGAATGAILAATIAGGEPAAVATVALAVGAGGVLVALAAAVLPALVLQRQRPGPLLAED